MENMKQYVLEVGWWRGGGNNFRGTRTLCTSYAIDKHNTVIKQCIWHSTSMAVEWHGMYIDW